MALATDDFVLRPIQGLALPRAILHRAAGGAPESGIENCAYCTAGIAGREGREVRDRGTGDDKGPSEIAPDRDVGVTRQWARTRRIHASKLGFGRCITEFIVGGCTGYRYGKMGDGDGGGGGGDLGFLSLAGNTCNDSWNLGWSWTEVRW